MSLAMAAGMKRIPWQQFCAGYGEMRQTQGRTAFGTGRMDLEQAKRILNISAEDDIGAVKRKYRRLIGCHHPDAICSDRPEHIRCAQDINEAYNLLKKSGVLSVSGKKSQRWQGIVNEKAFCDRNIYLYYTLDVSEKKPYYQTARGRYMWDPDEEDFELFLTSIRHAVKELLEKTEERFSSPGYEDTLAETEKFEFQVQLFTCLAMQYVDPVRTLRKIAQADHVDARGREVYRFRAFLGAKGQSQVWKTMTLLQKGDTVYPASFRENKIAVMDGDKRSLGYLSLEDDQLYFCIVPLLKKRLARIRMTVRDTEVSRKTHPYRVKVELDFFFRLEEGAGQYADSEYNLRIADILNRYERMLKNA